MKERLLHKSKAQPHAQQIKEVLKWGNDTFATQCTQQFADLGLPRVTLNEVDYEPNDRPILLALKNVHPHNDTWIGLGEEEPLERLAVFWVLKCGEPIWFGVVGHEPVKMHAGDYVVFDDSQTHFVLAEKKWHGASWQLLSTIKE